MGYAEHIARSKDTPVTCAVLTVSDPRTEETDTTVAVAESLIVPELCHLVWENLRQR